MYCSFIIGELFIFIMFDSSRNVLHDIFLISLLFCKYLIYKTEFRCWFPFSLPSKIGFGGLQEACKGYSKSQNQKSINLCKFIYEKQSNVKLFDFGFIKIYTNKLLTFNFKQWNSCNNEKILYILIFYVELQSVFLLICLFFSVEGIIDGIFGYFFFLILYSSSLGCLFLVVFHSFFHWKNMLNSYRQNIFFI